ncbi:hypothetical protein [Pseudotamlana carrageenivorans]|uniref:Uncharacterized protein n=1 Tax=Pseudotamlana carrageenivorans TaxID=2069432 RepID=A0A2I7SKN6_9FLAO|nr:hypothetical protein [Tamlana carrageenivorans]AUS06486.1 hypothetical protein C1A40_13985 [Tamlana carrageenivorans]
MALNKTALKSELQQGFINIFSDPKTENNVEEVAEQLADLISNKVNDFVKTGSAIGVDSRGDTHNLTIE